MSTIDLNIETICKLRKRQQLFAMPSFRATIVSPYPTYTEQQLNMKEILPTDIWNINDISKLYFEKN